MALICAQAVDSFTTTGTGNLVLANAVPAGTPNGFNSEKPTTFAVALGSPAIAFPINNVLYFATDGLNFELGVGNLLSATSWQRVNVLWSSNSGQLVNWAAGTKTILSNPNLILSQEGSWQRNLFSALPENTVVEGNFTGTVNSGSTATPAVFTYKIDNGGKVTISVPAGASGTAVGTTLTVTGIPAFLSNIITGKLVPCLCLGTTAGGVVVPGLITMAPGATPILPGTWTVSQYTSLTTGFSATFTTATVTGLAQCDFSYNLF